MALKKKTNIYGCDVEYIIIDNISYDKKSNTTTFNLSYYKDEQERRNDLGRKIYSKSHTLAGYKTLEDCYNYLKSDGGLLHGSEDVFEEKEEEPVQEIIVEQEPKESCN